MKKDLINKGFTLIELMIVLAIISVLLSISLMCYSSIISRNHDRAAIILGQSVFETAEEEYEREDFIVDTEAISNKIENSFNLNAEVQGKSDGSISIEFYYMNAFYDLEGNLQQDSLTIINCRNGDEIYEN